MRTGRPFEFVYVPVKSHYIQAAVQFCIYAYWGWYWRKVYTEMPLILGQIIFLYIFSTLLAWSRGRKFQLGFGPWPIIFSTNLFLWFKDDWFFLQFLMVALGALGKEFIQWRRDDRWTHIFNPSAFGLALVSFALVLTGTSGLTWGWEIATTLARPSHIYLAIFLVGLVVQGFFGVTLMTFSATAALCALNLIYTRVTGVYFFVDVNIPIAVFLGLHLLVTDPATTPKANAGKVIFGCLYGVGVWICFAILRRFNLPEYYDKLLIVPFLNLSVRLIDRIAAWNFFGAFARWENHFGPKKLNAIHIGCWSLVFFAMLGTGFVQVPHPGASISFWEKAAAEGRSHAAENLVTKLTLLAYSGNGDAANELGDFYRDGKFVAKDAVRAEHFFALAQKLNAAVASPLTPELLAKMQTLLARDGREVDVPAALVTELNFNSNQSWPARQVALSLEAHPDFLHSVAVSRDGNEGDLLVSLRTPAQLYFFRARRDGTLVSAVISDEQTRQSISMDTKEAQLRLNQEFIFWAGATGKFIPENLK